MLIDRLAGYLSTRSYGDRRGLTTSKRFHFGLFIRLAALTATLWAAAAVSHGLVTAYYSSRVLHEMEDVSVSISEGDLDAARSSLKSIEEVLAATQSRLGHPVLEPLLYIPPMRAGVDGLRDLVSPAVRLIRHAQLSLREMTNPSSDLSPEWASRVLGQVAPRAAAMANSCERMQAELQEASGLDLGIGRYLSMCERKFSSVSSAAMALAEFFQGPRRYLLLVANNAEMRAGSGMFLQSGIVTIDSNTIFVSRVDRSMLRSVPEDGMVQIHDDDLRARWGYADPDTEWRNLALTPRFAVTAELARQMWYASTHTEVDGVVAVDSVAFDALLEATDGGRAGLNFIKGDVLEFLIKGQYGKYPAGASGHEVRRADLHRMLQTALKSFAQDNIRAELLMKSVLSSVAGRHILLWSALPEEQAAWDLLGASGRMRDNSLMVSSLNAGANKLDPYLYVRVKISSKGLPSGRQQVRLTINLRNNAEGNESSYVVGPYRSLGATSGEYVGILAVHVPRNSTGIASNMPQLPNGGSDGPVELIPFEVRLRPGEAYSVTVVFTQPAGIDALRVEPSARVPPILYSVRGHKHASGSPLTIQLGGED